MSIINERSILLYNNNLMLSLSLTDDKQELLVLSNTKPRTERKRHYVMGDN